MLKSEIVDFQDVMGDLLDPFSNDEKKPSYYILNFKDKTIIPVSGLSIRALKAFGKDRYSVFVKRWKEKKDLDAEETVLTETIDRVDEEA